MLEQLASVQAQIHDLQVELSSLEGRMQEVASGADDSADDVVQTRKTAATREEQEELRDTAAALSSDARDLVSRRRDLIRRIAARKGPLKTKELEALQPHELHAAATAVIGTTAPEVEDLKRLLAIQGEWTQRFGRSPEFKAAVIARADVVGATCIGFAGVPGTLDAEFDLCIIDEASRATSTEALVPLTRARRWIIVGDALGNCRHLWRTSCSTARRSTITASLRAT